MPSPSDTRPLKNKQEGGREAGKDAPPRFGYQSWILGILTFVFALGIAVAAHYPRFPSRLNLHLKFPPGEAGRVDVIIATGTIGRADFLRAHYLNEKTAVLTYESWGRTVSSPTIQYIPGHRYAFQLDMPAITTAGSRPTQKTGLVRVTLDGIDVLRQDVPFFACERHRVFFGENPVGGPNAGTWFQGEITDRNGRIIRGTGRQIFSTSERIRAWASSRWWHLLPLVLLGLGVTAVAESVVRGQNTLAACATRACWTTVKSHAWFLGFALVAAIVFVWLMTGGTFRLIYPDAFAAFYDAQAQSLLRGRLDVPDWALGGEAFIVGGKYYGYFGLTPALLRLPFALLSPASFGHMTRCWMLFDYAVCLTGGYLLLVHFTRTFRGAGTRPSVWSVALLISAAGLGSTLLFLASRAYVYHEAILCGVAFALWSSYFSFRYLEAPRSRWWIGALLCGTLATQARPPSGLFALGLLSLVALAHLVAHRRNPKLWRVPVMAVMLAIGGFVSLQAVGYLKFGTFEGAPLRYHTQFTPERLARVEGKNFHLANLRHNLDAYVLRPAFQTGLQFPFFVFDLSKRDYPSAKIDVEEHTVSILYSMAGLALLAAAGFAGTLGIRQARQPMSLVFLASIPMVACMLMFVSTSHRYTADFCPPMIVAAAFGLVFFDTFSGTQRALLMSGAGAATLFSIALTLGLALHFQFDLVWGVPEEVRSNFLRLREFVDR